MLMQSGASMSNKAAIHHLTRYRYDRPVTLGPHIVRLRPAPHTRTHVIAYALKVTPDTHFVNHQQDLYGNWQARFVFSEPVETLVIAVDLTVDLMPLNPFDFFIEDSAEHWPFAYHEDITPDLDLFLRTDPLTPRVAAFLERLDMDRQRTIDMIVGLNSRITETIGYVTRYEPGVLTPEETLDAGKGSCRDASWLLVQILRHLGIAARFVSGYLVELKPDDAGSAGAPDTEQDFAGLHAWAEAYIPGAGWIGLDPTSGLLTGESHIPLAAAPHYRNVAPISGTASVSEVDVHFDMHIKRLAE